MAAGSWLEELLDNVKAFTGGFTRNRLYNSIMGTKELLIAVLNLAWHRLFQRHI